MLRFDFGRWVNWCGQADEKTQKAIREEFQRATLFVVAHRLNVILDGDWVAVLKRGKIGSW
jgi:ABC-type multidrug transport system fused ATPase/permease subunit